ncbi:(2Fe-2S)-binding protein [Desulfothermus okinawensis JCM 13304]
METQICYCFGYTDKDIEKDVIENKGQSKILEKIQMEKSKGNCNCKELNPKGR